MERAYSYISGEDPKKVIWCNSENGCEVHDSNATENEKTYYINALNTKTIIVCSIFQCTIEESGAKSNEYSETKYYMSGVNNVDMIRCYASNCISFTGEFQNINILYKLKFSI